MPHTLWNVYSDEVLAWRLGEELSPVPGSPETLASAKIPVQQSLALAQRLARLCQRTPKAPLLLLGSGGGQVLDHLRTMLPTTTVLTLETNVTAARAVRQRFALDPLPPCFHLLTDTSPWSLLMLTLGAGLDPEQCLLSWTAPRRDMGSAAAPLETWRKLFLGSRRLTLPAKSPAMRISLGAILHPDEHGLQEFFAQIPPWVHEAAVVWDSASPVTPPPCPVPLRTCCRPLGADFAAQRNAMLDLCTGDFCFYLDADERLEAEHWDSLPHLAALCTPAALGSSNTGAGVLFPRLTFEKNTAHARMGYGLWPDVQLRFFPLAPRPRFAGSVHERVEGLPGPLLLMPGLPLLHYSHVLKDGEALRQRLQTFDHAAKSFQHRLNDAYPHLAVNQLRAAGASFGGHTALLLPR